jgi:spermidine synthase
MSRRRLVLVLYVLSGACGLVYEIVWMRRLSLAFGITVFATSTVLAAFMAGLGLGSWLVGRRVDRSPDPLRVYAALEIGIGLYALAVPAIFAGLEPVYIAVSRALEGHFLLFNVARGAIAFAVFLVPTTMMGGTVPAIGRYLVAQADTIGWNVGLLYALNTLGAVGGCLAAGFVLVADLGMAGTTAAAALVNVTIGGLLLLTRGDDATAAPADAAPAADGEAPPAALARLATFVFALSGFSALAYEVVWTRVMVVHVHNTTYAFSAMLAVFLAGLTVGDALLMRAYDRIRRPVAWLGLVEVLIGLSVVVAAAAYAPMRESQPIGIQSWTTALLTMFRRSGLVLLPGALLFGTTFPLVARAVCGGLGTVGRDLGRAYAANTFGAILGSLAGGFLLVPMLGLRGTLLLLSGGNILLGGLCWVRATRGLPRAALALVALGLLLVPGAAIPRSIFFDALQWGPFDLIYYLEGLTDTTGVWQSRIDGSRIVTYGDLRGTAGTHTNTLNRLQGHIAHLLHPRPTRSLQIGFGVGNTLAATALHPEVERADCAELSPHVRQTAPYFWTNQGVLDVPKVHLIFDDGRNYLLRTAERYQVITLEPPDIYTAGVVNLYTEEFYRLAYRALTDDGLMCQWIPGGEMGDLEQRMLVAAFLRVFPETMLWQQGPFGPLLLVGTKHPMRIDEAELARRMAAEPVHADLVKVGIPDPAALFRLFIAGPARTRGWVGDATAVTDDRTIVDFTTPRAVYSGFGFGYFRLQGAGREEFSRHMASLEAQWKTLREPIAPWLAGGADGKGAP